MKAVTVDKIGIDAAGEQAVVFLKEADSRRLLPVWIGMQEATAIVLKLNDRTPPRPLTADLLKTVLDTLDAQVLMVVLNDMKDSVFYARIFLRGGTRSSTIELDARPSDAIGLALRSEAPIYVADWILDQAGADEDTDFEQKDGPITH